MATKIASLEASQVFEIKHLVEKEKIDCDFILTRAVDVCLDQAHADKTKAEFEALLATGEASLQDVHYAPTSPFLLTKPRPTSPQPAASATVLDSTIIRSLGRMGV
jgi:hypothetical protein